MKIKGVGGAKFVLKNNQKWEIMLNYFHMLKHKNLKWSLWVDGWHQQERASFFVHFCGN
jgi:hypothetical protein